jgi:predicted dehydrogenase
MPDRIGVAFVGCTHPHIFPRHELLLAEPDVRLVGCYDPDASLAATLEQRYGLRAFASPEELLDQPGVNFAIVEGWDPDNPRYVRMALARGQAVLLEKPGAPNLPEMRSLMGEVRAAQVPFQVGYMLRFSPALEHARKMLADGVLGPITLARFHAAAPVGGAAERWQSVPGDLGGLVYTDGCHMVDLIVHLLGMPRRVRGMLLTMPAGQPVLAHGFKKDTLSGLGETLEMPLGGLMYEDAGAAMLDYGDKLATFDITGWEAHPWVEAWRIELYGTDGTLHIGLQPPLYKLYVRNEKPGYSAGWHSWEGFGVHGVGISLVVDANYQGEMSHMLDRVRRWDTDNARWIDEAEGVIRVLDAIFRSDSQGTTVEL